ncbi:MAG: tRNA lysidine(34) synthetase TilS [Limnospira sp.]
MSDALSWTPLHAKLHRVLRSRKLLPPASRLLVAVSGGQDSLCLIRLLSDLQPKWDWTIAIAHCDHRWRPDSGANADHIERLAKNWKIPFYRLTAEHISASEAAARQWRYRVLGEVALSHNYDDLVTGHTASDRAETLLYNLIRGSGADGLAALRWSRPLFPENPDSEVMLVRPLLEITRSETGDFCKNRNLEIWEDSTNADLRHARNRIRRQLLPYLQTHFNPKAEGNLARTAELLRADVDYLETEAEKLYEMAIGRDRDRPGVNRQSLKKVPLALQRRVMRRLLLEVGAKAVNFEQIEKLTALISAPNRSQTDPFPGGAIARVEGDWITINN